MGEVENIVPREVDEVDGDEATEEDRRKRRQEEWGKQFDIWLIRAARSSRQISFLIRNFNSKLGADWEVGTPLRIDKEYIQIKFSTGEEWVSKEIIVRCKDYSEVV